MNYYNEWDQDAAAWLRQLIDKGLIPHGVVDTRSITEVKPDDIQGFTQCHFFAGIGGWSHALQLAGWSSARPVWTGSCPCQPFSVSGSGKGVEDERHLWPEFRRLIEACKPPVVFGEQVASELGREWFVGVRADLEALGVEVGAADLPACAVGSPMRRNRLFWVGYPKCSGLEGHPGHGNDHNEQGWFKEESFGSTAPSGGERNWNYGRSIFTSNGKRRRLQPGIEPLVNGFPERMVLCKGYGNAINPVIAAAFIRSSEQARTLSLDRGTYS